MDQAQDEIPDPGRPSTWVKYKSGMCEGCRAQCCQLPVEVSAVDLIRLGWAREERSQLRLRKQPSDSLKKRSFRLTSPHPKCLYSRKGPMEIALI